MNIALTDMMKSLFIIPLLFYGFAVIAQDGANPEVYQSPFNKRIDLVSISSDGKNVVASDESGYIFYWGRDGSIRKIIRAESRSIKDISFTTDGKYLISLTYDNQIALWNYASGQKATSITCDSPPLAAAFNTNNNTLYFAQHDGIFKASLLELEKKKHIQNLNPVAGSISDDNQSMILGDENSLTLFSISEEKILSKTNTCEQLRLVEFKGNLVCAFCEDRQMELFELKGNNLVKIASARSPIIEPLKLMITPDKKVLIISDSRSLMWNAETGKIHDLPDLPQDWTALGYGDKGNFFAGNSTGKIISWKADEGMEIMTVSQPAAATPKEAVKTPLDGKVAMTTGGIPKSIDGRPVVVQPPVEVASSTLEIFVWDNEREDGDIISLNLNGEWVLYEYMIVTEKKKLTFELLPDRTNYLVLYAHNLGKFPPNTAVVSFHDGNQERQLTLESDLKKCGAISFVVKQ